MTIALPIRRSPVLGIVAFVASVSALVLGVAGVMIASFSLARIVRISDYPDLIQETQNQLWDTLQRAMVVLVILVIAWIVHALLALWGLIQGIVATSLGRGRGWAIAAIGIGAMGWILLGWFTREALVAGALGIIPFVG